VYRAVQVCRDGPFRAGLRIRRKERRGWKTRRKTVSGRRRRRRRRRNKR